MGTKVPVIWQHDEIGARAAHRTNDRTCWSADIKVCRKASRSPQRAAASWPLISPCARCGLGGSVKRRAARFVRIRPPAPRG